jgi:hypothetical protein
VRKDITRNLWFVNFNFSFRTVALIDDLGRREYDAVLPGLVFCNVSEEPSVLVFKGIVF